MIKSHCGICDSTKNVNTLSTTQRIMFALTDDPLICDVCLHNIQMAIDSAVQNLKRTRAKVYEV